MGRCALWRVRRAVPSAPRGRGLRPPRAGALRESAPGAGHLAQLGARPGVTPGGGIALVEDEVDDLEHRGQTRGELGAAWDFERNAGLAEVRFARTMRCAIVVSGRRKALAISSVVSPPRSRRVRATRASAERTGWHATRTSRSRSSATPSSIAVSKSAGTCGSADASFSMASCFRCSIRRRRSWSSARFFAVVMSHAPGLWGMPVCGHDSRATTSASCARSSASPTSRTMRTRPPISLTDSTRQTASMALRVAPSGIPSPHEKELRARHRRPDYAFFCCSIWRAGRPPERAVPASRLRRSRRIRTPAGSRAPTPRRASDRGSAVPIRAPRPCFSPARARSRR